MLGAMETLDRNVKTHTFMKVPNVLKSAVLGVLECNPSQSICFRIQMALLKLAQPYWVRERGGFGS